MMALAAHHGLMFMPVDVKALSRQALRGYGPEDPQPLPPRKRWWYQPTARPRWMPVKPAWSRSRASARSVPSSVR
jgi:hypothetical protein